MPESLIKDRSLHLYERTDVDRFGCPSCGSRYADYVVIEEWQIAGAPIVQVRLHRDCDAMFRVRYDSVWCEEVPLEYPDGVYSSVDLDADE